ncbi:hypothetical protein M0812_09467 [Anaeramoeba flamelloides]|uniref:Uncharacterized protein n=1 Tax=Anaeramoeba flamelloides TaxID=1746091 RepID=A0AAV7ZPS7_9EUKA|nr:hypothetical protein M0812_09467 [Anaeramoeba flamelloides]
MHNNNITQDQVIGINKKTPQIKKEKIERQDFHDKEKHNPIMEVNYHHKSFSKKPMETQNNNLKKFQDKGTPNNHSNQNFESKVSVDNEGEEGDKNEGEEEEDDEDEDEEDDIISNSARKRNHLSVSTTKRQKIIIPNYKNKTKNIYDNDYFFNEHMIDFLLSPLNPLQPINRENPSIGLVIYLHITKSIKVHKRFNGEKFPPKFFKFSNLNAALQKGKCPRELAEWILKNEYINQDFEKKKKKRGKKKKKN